MASGDLFRAFTVRFSYKKEQHVRMLEKFEDKRLNGGKMDYSQESGHILVEKFLRAGG